MAFSYGKLLLIFLTIIVLLPLILAIGEARIHPAYTIPQPPPLPNYVSRPFLVTPWEMDDQQFVFNLHHHLRWTYDLPAIHIVPAHYDPITTRQLEEQIRQSANEKRFIQLGASGPGRRSMRIAFAIQGTHQGHGQKYFALLHVGREYQAADPYVFVTGFVKASGVERLRDAIPSPEALRGARTLTVPGAPLTAHEVFDALQFF